MKRAIMPRKKSNPTTLATASVSGTTDMLNLITDASYLVKWNAPLALSWMNDIAPRLASFTEVEAYNRTVRRINHYLNHLEKMRYYNRKEVWGALSPARLEEI